ASHGPPVLEASLAGPAARLPRSRPRGLDGAGAGRPRLVRPLAVPCDPPPGLAPAAARHRPVYLPARGRSPGPHDRLGAPTGYDVGRPRSGLQGSSQTAALYVAGTLGGRVRGSLAAADRFAAGGRRGLLVWAARLDRARLQAAQKRWLALGADPHDRP